MEEVVALAEVERLGIAGKTVVDDPSVLNHNLREACKLLNTRHHEKADQIIGTMIALHSSRMLSTCWTVLLQCLRESSEARAQLGMLKHFAHIAYRISIPQRTNAFKVFAKESIGLIATLEIVANRTFLSSFCAITTALGVYAEAALANTLLGKLTEHLLSSSRNDIRRAAALMAAQLVGSTLVCGSFTLLFSSIESKGDLLSACILMDSSLPLLLEQATRLSRDPFTYHTVADAKERISKWIQSLLLVEPIAYINVPVLISCYEKMKQFDHNWSLIAQDQLITHVTKLVSCKNTRAVIISPLLTLFRLLNPTWVGETEGVWNLTQHQDPMIRFEALRAVAATVPQMDFQLAANLLDRAFQLSQTYKKSQCSYTVAGTLNLFTALIPITYRQHKGVFHQILRSHLDLACPINSTSLVRLQVLQLLEKIPTLQINAFSYVIHCTLDDGEKIRKYAFILLEKWSRELVFDEMLFKEPHFRVIDFLEGFPCENLVLRETTNSWLSSTRGLTLLIFHFTERLYTGLQSTSQDYYHTIQYSCEAIIHVSSSIRKDDQTSLNAMVFEEIFYYAFIKIQDFLHSAESLPFNVYLALIKTAVSTLQHCDGRAYFDIFTHKRLFNYTWNILHRCCKAIDPIAVPQLPRERSLYLAWHILPDGLEHMITSSALSGLSNTQNYKDTHLFGLVEHTTALFTELLSFGSHSPVFVEHLRHLYCYALGCFDILAGSNPVASLRGCHALFNVLFCNDNITNIVFRSKEKLRTERENFISTVITILTRSLAFDLTVVGNELFDFIKTFIQIDKLNNEAHCYMTVDADFSLVRRLVSIVSDRSYYNAVRGASVVEPILSVLNMLLSSPYVSYVFNICGIDELNTILHMINELIEETQADTFERCRQLVQQMLTYITDSGTKGIVNMRFKSLSFMHADTSEGFSSGFKSFCEIVSNLSGSDIKSLLETLMTHNDSLPEILCACVLDISKLSLAVELALQKYTRSFILDKLLLLIANTDENAKIERATLVIKDCVLIESNDYLITHIIDSFSWGWKTCCETSRTLELIIHTNCSLTLRRALYDAARLYMIPLPESVLNHPQLEEIVSSFDSTMIPLNFNVSVNKEIFICQKPPISESNAPFTNLEGDVPAWNSETEEDNELFAALSLSPLFISAVSQTPNLLLKSSKLLSFVIPEVLECLPGALAKDVVITMADRGFLNTMQANTLSELTKLLIRGHITSLQLDILVVEKLFERILTILEGSSDESEDIVSLRYCSMYMLVLIAPNEEHRWQHILCDESQSSEVLTRLKKVVILIINKCLGISAVDVKSISKYVVSIFLRLSNLNQGIDESMLWLVVKCCTISVWQVIVGGELCDPLELSSLKFLCKLNQTVGLPPELIPEMHAHYTPLLLSFGSSREINSDEQRIVFWIITSLLLHTTVSEERFTKPKTHMALTDNICQYADFPLELLSSETTARIRSLCNASTFSFYAQLPSSPNERHWNIHTTGYLLPMCGRSTTSKEVTEKIFTSLLHLYVHVITSVFNNISKLPVYCMSDVFFSLGTLCTGNAPLLKHSQAYEGSIAESILPSMYSWYRQYGSLYIDAALTSRTNTLRARVCLLPDSNEALPLLDCVNTIACTTIMLSLFTVGNEKIAGFIDAGDILIKMLNMDLCTYLGAITAIIIMSGTSTRREFTPVASKLTSRLFDDLDSCSWGSLSFSFGILQILRCACGVISLLSDDTVSMKVCEALWNGVLSKPYGRRIRHYTYYVLQSIACLTSVDQTQWQTLRALVGGRINRDSREDGVPCGSIGLTQHHSKILSCDGSLQSMSHISGVHEVSFQLESSLLAHKLAVISDRLLYVVTAASLILRSSYSEYRNAESDRNRVQVITLLESIPENPSYVDGIILLLVQELMSQILEQEDTLFTAMNRFDFLPISKRLLLQELQKLSARVQKENTDFESCWFIISDTMKPFFEACLRKNNNDSASWWWIICAMLNTFFGLRKTDVSCVVAVVLLEPPNVDVIRQLALNLTSHISNRSESRFFLRNFITELDKMCSARFPESLSFCDAAPILKELLEVIVAHLLMTEPCACKSTDAGNDVSLVVDVLVPLSRVLGGNFDCPSCKKLRARVAYLHGELEALRTREAKQRDELRRLHYEAQTERYRKQQGH